jgi:23S rRNA pseudouridine1911/1915/1917 synthase
MVELVPTAQSQAFHAEAMALSIVHEDDDVLVLDKPPGLVVHPAPGHWSGTLMNGLLAHHAGAFDLPRAGIVHRLDKDTSGLMVVAKNLVAMTALVRAMAAREVAREYLAIAHGTPAATAFTIDAPIGRDPVSRVRMALRTDGKAARTDVECLASAGGFSALRCRLHTGRTHQIRVHLASRGMPLVCDSLYGGAPALGMSRQALHAARLAFVHPRGAQPLDFTAQAPRDFDEAWRRVVRGYNRG